MEIVFGRLAPPFYGDYDNCSEFVSVRRKYAFDGFDIVVLDGVDVVIEALRNSWVFPGIPGSPGSWGL